jgi:hypothetical protein
MVGINITIPTKRCRPADGLDARAKPQRVRGKLVLGLGASPEDRVGAILTTAPTIYKAGKIGHFPFSWSDVRHIVYKCCSGL